MDMMNRFQQNFVKLNQAEKVLAAVSTGVDSMVMLQLLLKLPKKIRPQVSVAYVNHRLRPASAQETEFIRSFCQKHHLPLFTTDWSPQQHPAHGIEAAARDFRYKFFAQIMQKQGISELLTAHHQDDQVETFMLKLIRGGQLQQLTGIAARRCFSAQAGSWILRPMLPFSKTEIRAYAVEQRIKYFEDETNFELKVLRNRLRNRFIPELVEENPQFKEHIINYQSQLACLQAAMKPLLEQRLQTIKTAKHTYSLTNWQQQPLAWQQLLLEKILSIPTAKITHGQQQQASELLNNSQKPQGRIDLEGNWLFFKEYDHFGVTYSQANLTAVSTDFCQQLRLGEWQHLEDGSQVGLFEWNSGMLHPKDLVFRLPTDQRFPLQIRHRQKGDRLVTAVGKQKVKKILIDLKLSKVQRSKLWIVADKKNRPIWLVGVKRGYLSEAAVNGRMLYMIIFRNEVAL
ncbi:tRNA lysidine(34) synthetase TilS [Liquorilactobacillus ghanensis]|jgi:tRNA(Ile)-lysidine synthetase-like protein|uniref:tRNA lysidine(34) synthetase TilS n=1 Tax=Liquorilactobacillus ghanensis TaxID=399370 RepID=UPI0039ED7D5D